MIGPKKMGRVLAASAVRHAPLGATRTGSDRLGQLPSAKAEGGGFRMKG
jgi:hypothetical protein